MVTDKIGDLINRIKVGNLKGKDLVVLQSSKLLFAVAEALQRSGFVKSVTKTKSGKIEITLDYKSDKAPKVTGVQRISKPSRRIYSGSEELKPFKNGFGTVIVSTPKGILSNKEARKDKVGGELMFKIW